MVNSGESGGLPATAVSVETGKEKGKTGITRETRQWVGGRLGESPHSRRQILHVPRT